MLMLAAVSTIWPTVPPGTEMVLLMVNVPVKVPEAREQPEARVTSPPLVAQVVAEAAPTLINSAPPKISPSEDRANEKSRRPPLLRFSFISGFLGVPPLKVTT
jgi:hypothetical protein